MEWQYIDVQRQGSRPKGWEVSSKLCFLTKACRQFCIFTCEFGTCSESPIFQGDTRTVSVPAPLDPMGITSQSIRGTSTGAVQTFITLILQGSEQASFMLSTSGAWAAQECPSLFWGIRPQNSNSILVCCTHRMVTCERTALCKQ